MLPCLLGPVVGSGAAVGAAVRGSLCIAPCPRTFRQGGLLPSFCPPGPGGCALWHALCPWAGAGVLLGCTTHIKCVFTRAILISILSQYIDTRSVNKFVDRGSFFRAVHTALKTCLKRLLPVLKP